MTKIFFNIQNLNMNNHDNNISTMSTQESRKKIRIPISHLHKDVEYPFGLAFSNIRSTYYARFLLNNYPYVVFYDYKKVFEDYISGDYFFLCIDTENNNCVYVRKYSLSALKEYLASDQYNNIDLPVYDACYRKMLETGVRPHQDKIDKFAEYYEGKNIFYDDLIFYADKEIRKIFDKRYLKH